MVEDVADAAGLDDAPGVHDHDAVADLGHKRRGYGGVMRMIAVESALSPSMSSRICAWMVKSSAVVGLVAMRMSGSAAEGDGDHDALAHTRPRARGDTGRWRLAASISTSLSISKRPGAPGLDGRAR